MFCEDETRSGGTGVGMGVGTGVGAFWGAAAETAGHGHGGRAEEASALVNLETLRSDVILQDSAGPGRGLGYPGPMRVFDCHVHVQPWEQMQPATRALMTAGRRDLAEIQEALADPAELLRLMDREGVERAALINYVAPEVMGFDASANDWVARYVRGHEDRLFAVGSVHPRHVADAGAETRRLFALGIRMLKIHPPHQLFAANALPRRAAGPRGGLRRGRSAPGARS